MKDNISDEFEPLLKRVSQDLRGKEEIIKKSIATFFANGHLLLEDIPGVGKTTLAKSFASALGLEFGRIQFTADMLPSDIIGVNYFDVQEGRFIFKKGPIFTQFLLADEINRSMPKTQSALLEAMEEAKVTIDGRSYELPKPFFVMATQNPYEDKGTFALPHSQLDRFLCSFSIGYPDKEAEREVLRGIKVSKQDNNTPIMSLEQIEEIMQSVKEVKLSDAMLDILQEVIYFTRSSGLFRYGLSTRGALALASMTRSWARLHGRDYAIADDMLAILPDVCYHRLRFLEGETTPKRIYDEITAHISLQI